VLGYVSISEEANIKLVEHVVDYPTLYDWSDRGYSRKEKN
jgi:hypothetical protein